MTTPEPKIANKWEGPTIFYIMCRACDTPITQFDPAHPFNVQGALSEHKRNTGHGADNFFPTPDLPPGRVLVQFEDAAEDVAVSTLGGKIA